MDKGPRGGRDGCEPTNRRHTAQPREAEPSLHGRYAAFLFHDGPCQDRSASRSPAKALTHHLMNSWFAKFWHFQSRIATRLGPGGAAALMVAALSVAPNAAHSEFQGDFFRITCAPELGIFRFEVMTIGGDVAERAVQDSAEAIADRYGLYYSGMLYDFAPSAEDPQKFVLSETRSRSVRCNLNANVIDVSFEPKLLRSSVTAILTARIDGILVLKKLPFDNSDRDGRHINSFSFTVGNPNLILDGAAVSLDSISPYGPQFFISKGYRFDGDSFLPLTDFVSVYDEMLEATPDVP